MNLSLEKLELIDDSIHALCGAMKNEDSNAKLYVYGSFGRRLALTGTNISLGDYFENARRNFDLLPRLNHRGKADIDVGIRENQVPWPAFASIAREVSTLHPEIEIDPHFFTFDEPGKIRLTPAVNDLPLKSPIQTLAVNTGVVTIPGESVKLYPFLLDEQLALMIGHCPPQYKYFSEMTMILAKQKNIEPIFTYPEIGRKLIRYINSVAWTSLPVSDAAKLLWRVLLPKKVRHRLYKQFVNPNETLNYNRTSPVYL